ncbi:MAG: class I SAM-dependent methyltransferase [Schwartzia sp.]|nr:class I SAM-dependent methyltransferase [Schwartzia sp. (in: firmicutes)]
MARLHTQFLKESGSVSLIEQDIDRYITTHANGVYDEVLAADDRWAVFSHLSDMRAGLFGWFDMPKDAEVLEIGCGFGALTGVLTDRSAHVTALDRSLFYAQSCIKRWSDRENLDVYAGRLRDMPFRQQFDIITLVDMLPRAANGAWSPAPYADYLKSLLAYLKPQGRLLLAMDNRLGLKYFCGARDPYSDDPFGELSGAFGGERLLTKAEITAILAQAGFTHWKFYYPLPDYRLPQFIFTDTVLPGDAVGKTLIPYDPSPGTRILPEAALYADIVRNGLFPAMANSFLVECGMQADFCPTESASLAFDRAPMYNIATCREGSYVRKKPVLAAARQGIRAIADNLATLRRRGLDVVPCELRDGTLSMPRFQCPTMAAWLRSPEPPEREAVLTAIERLWAAILQSSPPVPDAKNTMKRLDPQADWGVILERAWLNMTPDNIFYENGKLIFFNQGLVRENCPAKYPMFLAVYDNAETFSRLGVLDQLKERYGLRPLWETMETAQRQEAARFHRYDTYHRFYDWAKMSPARMLKNCQILKIIGNEDNE